MAYNLGDLQSEIEHKIESLKAKRPAQMPPDWITHAILADHPDVEGADADFYRCCSHVTVRKLVREQLNRTDAAAATAKSPQLVLEGFEHLQHYYMVTRKREQISVRIDLCTDEEIEAKIREYESMGRACLSHADELRRYLDLRRSGVAILGARV